MQHDTERVTSERTGSDPRHRTGLGWTRVVAALGAVALALVTVPLGAQSASAWTCQGYVNKAGTNQPYSMLSGSVTQHFACDGHSGVDIARADGSDVKAVATGEVVERGWEYTSAAQTTKGCHGKYTSSCATPRASTARTRTSRTSPRSGASARP